MCTRTSANVQTLSRHAATAALLQRLAVHQLRVVTATAVAMVAAMAATLTQAAVLQLPAVTHVATVVATAATLTQAAVLQLLVVMHVATAAMQTQAAVLQLPVVTHVATAVAMAATLTQAAVLQLLVATDAEATPVAKPAIAATTTAARSQS